MAKISSQKSAQSIPGFRARDLVTAISIFVFRYVEMHEATGILFLVNMISGAMGAVVWVGIAEKVNCIQHVVGRCFGVNVDRFC